MGQWSKRCNYDNMLGRPKIKLFIILQHFLYFIANNYTGFFSIFIASTSPRLIMLSRSCQKATAKIMILITWWSNQFCVVILVQPILPTYTSCTWKNLFLCHTILYCCSCATTVKSLSALLLQPLISKVYNIDIKKKNKSVLADIWQAFSLWRPIIFIWNFGSIWIGSLKSHLCYPKSY